MTNTTLTRAFYKMGLRTKKHIPEVLVAAGVVGVVASGVMACKATTKLSTVLDDHKEQTDQINTYVEKNGYSEKYSEEDQKKDLAIVYTQTGVKLAKLYTPSIVLGAVSIAMIVASNRILSKRNVSLAAAYAIVDRNFKEYRERVVERFGEGLDRDLRYNIKAKEIERVVDNEDGSQSIVKDITDEATINTTSDYARFFDNGCAGWEKDSELNLMFLRRQQEYANHKLQTRGYLFLNEVYEMLGIPRTKAGQCVGWVYDEKNPIGDNYVNFGIYNANDERKRDFVNGYERTILLDFNVDGNILDYI